MRKCLLGIVLTLWSCAGSSLPTRPEGPLNPGDGWLMVTHGGATRKALIHVPPGATGRRPVVLSFHGGGGGPVGHRDYTGLDKVADREGFLTVYPAGSEGVGGRLLTFNAGGCCGPAMDKGVDDVGFVRALLAELDRRGAVDLSRVYATGLSNGGMMAYRLAAEASDLVAAIAPVAGAVAQETPLAPRYPVPVLHFHSQDDPRALYQGGESPPFPLTRRRSHHLPVEQGLARWRTANGCPNSPKVSPTLKDPNGQTATLLTYGPCRDGAEVALWRFTQVGHVWPGGNQSYQKELLGAGTSLVDANEAIWAFFKRFQRTR